MDSSETDAGIGIRSATAMVATGHPLAARAARDMLAAGGSAVDAAIAADAVLGVVEPMATGIGGDLLAMLIEADGHAISYNGTGRSPAALSAEMIEKLPNQRIPERHVLSVTVPGAVRGWFDLHARYGRLPFQQLLAPAITLATDGFAVLPITAREWAVFEPVIKRDSACAKLYRAGNTPLKGERFANPELAAILRAIGTDGPDAFYLGAPARQAAAASQAQGGALSAQDFANHRGDFVLPLERKFRGLTVLECPPNTHGIAVLDALEELDALPLDRNDPATTLAMGRGRRARHGASQKDRRRPRRQYRLHRGRRQRRAGGDADEQHLQAFRLRHRRARLRLRAAEPW
jgi:gamma-glutamyltranspeptidase/glutathione hydrolase